MYGSIRACCASTSELEDFGRGGIQWGDCEFFFFFFFFVFFLGLWFHFRYCSFSYCGLWTLDFGLICLRAIVGMGENFRHAGFSADGSFSHP